MTPRVTPKPLTLVRADPSQEPPDATREEALAFADITAELGRGVKQRAPLGVDDVLLAFDGRGED